VTIKDNVISTTTQSGLIAVWVVDPRGEMQPAPIHQHRLQSGIAECVMLQPLSRIATRGSVLDTFSWQNKSSSRIAEKIQDPISCFCVTHDGRLA